MCHNRGTKKTLTTIAGMEKFGCNVANVAKLLGKKFGTGASVIEEQGKEIIQVQGNILHKLEDFLENDLKVKIPVESIDFQDGTTKKKVKEKKKKQPKGSQEQKHASSSTVLMIAFGNNLR